jgi:hypothetical protein
MRAMLIAVAFALLPVSAGAQSGTHQTHPVLPPIGLPLPPIGLPLAPIGLPPASATAADPVMSPHQDSPRGQRSRVSHRDRRVKSPSLVYVSPYPWFWPEWDESVVTTPEPAAPQPAAYVERPARSEPETGLLRLDVELVAEAQLYVDGYFIGTVAEIGREFRLYAGAHAIEVRAEGFEPLGFDAVITPGRSVTWRAAMTRAPVAESPRPAAAAESVFYLIPGCYMGNVHPRELELPAGCDVSLMIVRRMR